MTLNEMIEKFENDTHWNTPNHDGSKRFDKEIAWIRSMVEQYAAKLGITPDEVATKFEADRNYSWPNYYQHANFPDLDNLGAVNIYETREEFHAENKAFKCPHCGTVGSNPVNCQHRIDKDGKCDWTAGGLFRFGLQAVIVKEVSYVPALIFPTAEVSNEQQSEEAKA